MEKKTQWPQGTFLLKQHIKQDTGYIFRRMYSGLNMQQEILYLKDKHTDRNECDPIWKKARLREAKCWCIRPMTGLTFLTFMAKAQRIVSRSPSTCPWPLQTMMLASCFLSGPRQHSLLPSLLFCPADLHFFNSGCYILACSSDALSPCLAWDLLLSEAANSAWSSLGNCWILSDTIPSGLELGLSTSPGPHCHF